MTLARVRRHLRRLGRFLRRPVADQWLAIQAFVLLGVSRWQIKRRGLAAVQERLGERMVDSPASVSLEEAAEVARIARAIVGVRSYTPWISNCFPQAVTAQRLLAKRQIASTVYFGASRSSGSAIGPADTPETGEFAAHAWVRSGDMILRGGDDPERYRAVVWFGTAEAIRSGGSQ